LKPTTAQLQRLTAAYQHECNIHESSLSDSDNIYLSILQILRIVEDRLWLFLQYLDKIKISLNSQSSSAVSSPSSKLATEVDNTVELLVSILEPSLIRCMYTLPYTLNSK